MPRIMGSSGSVPLAWWTCSAVTRREATRRRDRIRLEYLIAADESRPLGDGLGSENPVKGILVDRRQLVECENVLLLNGRNADTVRRLLALDNLGERQLERELARLPLDL